MSLLERWLYRLLHDDGDSNRRFRKDDDDDPRVEVHLDAEASRLLKSRGGDDVAEVSGQPRRETR